MQDNPSQGWSVAIVRWIRQVRGGGTQMGIELIAPHARPCGLQLLRKGCLLYTSGLKRVLLLLADRHHTRLQTQQQAGLDAGAASLSLDPAQSQVLKRLLAEPGQLRLTPDNMAQFSALLPGNLKALFPSEHLLLRSRCV